MCPASSAKGAKTYVKENGGEQRVWPRGNLLSAAVVANAADVDKPGEEKEDGECGLHAAQRIDNVVRWGRERRWGGRRGGGGGVAGQLQGVDAGSWSDGTAAV